MKSAIKSVREYAVDLIVDEMRIRGSMDVPTDKLTTIVGASADSPFEEKDFLSVSKITLGAGKDSVDLTGKLEDANREVTVSVYDVEDPESILAYLEATAE